MMVIALQIKPMLMETHNEISLLSSLTMGIETSHPLAGQRRKLVDNPIDATRKKPKLTTSRKISPADFVTKAFKDNGYYLEDVPSDISFSFVKPTEERIAAYKLEAVQATRSENVDELRKLRRSGLSLDCCNRFGESLISIACRRGNADLVRFLVEECDVTLLQRDDYGRTVLHDAFWTSKPAKELVHFLLQEAPDLLLVKDVRGHAPLDYVRNEHWDEWIAFLKERKGMLRPKLTSFSSFVHIQI
jgi:hypothetical protein